MMSQTADVRPARRHDLDALRAVAMLLGIALHAWLSFAPRVSAVWPVQDVRQNDVFEILNAAIHGFRMPLFFLISGFFTAMLWRSRGLKSLAMHRLRRIYLPFLVSLFTILPITWGVMIYVGSAAANARAGSDQPVTDDVESLWAAVFANDAQQIEQLIGQGVTFNQVHPQHGGIPLGAAIAYNHPDLVRWMLEHGADVDFRTRDQDTPLHIAAFFGRDACFRMLIDHGADPTLRNRSFALPADVARLDWPTTEYIAKLVDIEVDREQVESGRAQILAQLAAASGDAGATGIAAPSENGLRNLYMLLVFFPLFHHLWFLWFLCWLIPIFLVYAWVMNRLSWRVMPRTLVLSPLRWLWLIPLTMVPQMMMGMLGPSFGPDTSSGLVPAPHILLYYAVFFFVGVWYFDANDVDGRVSRGWAWMLGAALLVLFPVGYELTYGTWGWRDKLENAAWIAPASDLLQVLYTWLMTFGMMGFFRARFAHPSPALRYVSDSSYWLYLAHLPLVILGQHLIRNWPLPSGVKCLLLITVTSCLLLLSYEYLVRYTWIGRMLNGPRTRPVALEPAVLPVAE
jgi:hypothetical protein